MSATSFAAAIIGQEDLAHAAAAEDATDFVAVAEHHLGAAERTKCRDGFQGCAAELEVHSVIVRSALWLLVERFFYGFEKFAAVRCVLLDKVGIELR